MILSVEKRRVLKTVFYFYFQSDVAKIRERSYGNLSHIAVPYSEHSSFSELKEFVSFCKPHKIVPTVDCSTQARVDAQIALFKDDMNHSRDRSTLVPFLSKFCKFK